MFDLVIKRRQIIGCFRSNAAHVSAAGIEMDEGVPVWQRQWPYGFLKRRPACGVEVEIRNGQNLGHDRGNETGHIQNGNNMREVYRIHTGVRVHSVMSSAGEMARKTHNADGKTMASCGHMEIG